MATKVAIPGVEVLEGCPRALRLVEELERQPDNLNWGTSFGRRQTLDLLPRLRDEFAKLTPVQKELVLVAMKVIDELLAQEGKEGRLLRNGAYEASEALLRAVSARAYGVFHDFEFLVRQSSLLLSRVEAK